jgi:SAM-dependent methyltransferase
MPSKADLQAVFDLKHGDLAAVGWSPRLRRRFGYFSPDDVYEALVDRLVTPGCTWMDVGCGRDLFPGNRRLAERLAARCGLLVGVDPAPTLAENPFVHERVSGALDELDDPRHFDLVTLRMVAEHVERPAQLAAALARCTRPGGRAVIYTVNRWSPVPLLTALVPFRMHQPIKRVLWRTETRDTFPTRFRMNTRRRLRSLLADAGFDEESFAYLDDCRTLGRFRALLLLELTAWAALRRLGLRYPESCLLGVYRRR